MYITKIHVENFRCIKNATINLPEQVVLVGDNNCGKSTLVEAIDLVLGPDRMSRHPVVDEHDFYLGKYRIDDDPVIITAEVIVVGLSEEQIRYFHSHIEWYDTQRQNLLNSPPASATDEAAVSPALRLCFIGQYNNEEDDFEGSTFFSSPVNENGQLDRFSNRDKRMCGFLYLRTLRTGSRALSMEHGSLLDIILTIKELRPQMWEDVIGQIKNVSVASDPALGISDVLTSVQTQIHKFLPTDTANNPVLKVTNLTREQLRKAITVFIDSGMTGELGLPYSIPYNKSGTGTINVLVLSLLSIIAELKQNVIFAMEEPEIAIPPYIQKSIILNVLKNSQQAIFTSHSPYVLEEFNPENVLILTNNNGELGVATAALPPNVKLKAYREDLRRKYFESLLSKRVLITEGRTEYDVYYSASRHLEELNSDKFSSFDRLGISLVNAETDTQIAALGVYYKTLNKTVYAVFDKQTEEALERITASVDKAYEAQAHGIEKVIINGVAETALRRFALGIVTAEKWPQHHIDCMPTVEMAHADLKEAMLKYFRHKKGEGALADLLSQCGVDEFPAFITTTLADLKVIAG